MIIMGLVSIILGFIFMFIPIIGWFFAWFFWISGIVSVTLGIIGWIFKMPFLLMGSDKAKAEETTIVQQISTDVGSELAKLSELLEKGHITSEEFETSKKALLAKY